MGDIDSAEFQQEAQLQITRREYPQDLDKLMPATFKLAALPVSTCMSGGSTQRISTLTDRGAATTM